MKYHHTFLRRLVTVLKVGLRLQPLCSAPKEEKLAVAEIIGLCSAALEMVTELEAKYPAPLSPPDYKKHDIDAFLKAYDNNEDKPAPLPTPRVLTTPVLSKPKTLKEPFVVWGTYGKWDYPTRDLEVKPTLSDIDDFRHQKLLRNPENQLWLDEELCLEWLTSKNYLTFNRRPL